MDSTSFDDLTRAVGERLNRRSLGRLAGAGALTAAVVATPALGEAPEAEARKKGRKRRQKAGAEHNVRGKKAIMCVNGETRKVPKSKRKKYLKQGATRGKCSTPICVPNCPAGTCGDDGCGGQCPSCPTGQVCAEGVCQVCNVNCTTGSTSTQCGDSLRDQLVVGGNIYVCPGTYAGPFTVGNLASIYGAGSGTDATVDAILTGEDTTQVMAVTFPGSVKLANLRFTNGSSTYGANLTINNAAANVTVDQCAFANGQGEYGMGVCVENGAVTVSNSVFTGNNGDYTGGGLCAYYGAATVTNSTFTGNTGEDGGGALAAHYTGSTVSASGCTFTGNFSDYGGALYAYQGTMTVTDSTVSGNTADNGGGVYVYGPGSITLSPTVSVTGNTATAAGYGGGVYVYGGTFTQNGATISGNTPDQCVGVSCT
ncbi:MAG: hypothetical protein QM692_13805 [Thermomicrobiales bacterium]